jgi:hypothetical protein
MPCTQRSGPSLSQDACNLLADMLPLISSRIPLKKNALLRADGHFFNGSRGSLSFISRFSNVRRPAKDVFLNDCETNVEVALSEVIGQCIVKVLHADDRYVVAVLFELRL